MYPNKESWFWRKENRIWVVIEDKKTDIRSDRIASSDEKDRAGGRDGSESRHGKVVKVVLSGERR